MEALGAVAQSFTKTDFINPASLAFDIDCVVADTMRLFVNIAQDEYHISSLRYEDITCYMLEDCLDLDSGIIRAIVEKLLDRDHTFQLEPIAGAPEVLAKLGKYHNPLLFVTARPSQDLIYEWMAEILPMNPSEIDIVATGSFEAKTEILLERGISYFVEDRLETCFDLRDAGITPVLFKQPWNREAHPFLEIDNWAELESLIEF